MRSALLLLAFLALASPASARVSPGAVADALGGDPVWVEPGASPSLSDAERGQLRIAIVTQEIGRIKIAVVDGTSVDAVGGIGLFANQVSERLGTPGTLLVSAAGDFHVVYSFEEGKRIAPALRAIVQRHGDEGLFAVLDRAVPRIARIDPGRKEDARDQLAPGGGSPRIPDITLPDFEGGSSSSDPFDGIEDEVGDVLGVAKTVVLVIGIVIALAVAFPIVMLLVRARRARALARRREELLEDDLRDRLVAVGDEIRALDLDHSMPGADAAGSAAYAAAVGHYDRAETALDRTDPDSVDVARAREELDQAEQQLAIARERFATPAAAPQTAEGA